MYVYIDVVAAVVRVLELNACVVVWENVSVPMRRRERRTATDCVSVRRRNKQCLSMDRVMMGTYLPVLAPVGL